MAKFSSDSAFAILPTILNTCILIIIFDTRAEFSYLSPLTKIFSSLLAYLTGRGPSIVLRLKLKLLSVVSVAVWPNVFVAVILENLNTPVADSGLEPKTETTDGRLKWPINSH